MAWRRAAGICSSVSALRSVSELSRLRAKRNSSSSTSSIVPSARAISNSARGVARRSVRRSSLPLSAAGHSLRSSEAPTLAMNSSIRSWWVAVVELAATSARWRRPTGGRSRPAARRPSGRRAGDVGVGLGLELGDLGLQPGPALDQHLLGLGVGVGQQAGPLGFDVALGLADRGRLGVGRRPWQLAASSSSLLDRWRCGPPCAFFTGGRRTCTGAQKTISEASAAVDHLVPSGRIQWWVVICRRHRRAAFLGAAGQRWRAGSSAPPPRSAPTSTARATASAIGRLADGQLGRPAGDRRRRPRRLRLEPLPVRGLGRRPRRRARSAIAAFTSARRALRSASSCLAGGVDAGGGLGLHRRAAPGTSATSRLGGGPAWLGASWPGADRA